MDEARPRSRGYWVLGLLLLSIWAAIAFDVGLALAGLPWAPVFIALTQLGVAGGIGSFDLIVLWIWIGVWEYRSNLREYMRYAFGTVRRARLFAKCPQCGYESEESISPSKAEILLRARERN